MKNVLITGAAGFVGSQLAHRLESKGIKVFCLDNMSFGHVSNSTRSGKTLENFLEKDVRDKSIKSIMTSIDVVFHFAGIAPLPNNQCDPQASISNNVEGTANIIEIARKAGGKEIQKSV